MLEERNPDGGAHYGRNRSLNEQRTSMTGHGGGGRRDVKERQ